MPAAPSAAEKKARLRHARYFAEHLIQMAPDILTGRDEAALATFDREWLQIRQAHSTVLSPEFQDDELAYRFFTFGGVFKQRRLPSREWSVGAGAALRHAKNQGPVEHAAVLASLSETELDASRVSRAHAYARAAVRLARQAGQADGTADSTDQRRQLALCLNGLSSARTEIGDFRGAVVAAGEALNISESIEYENGQSLALGHLGAAFMRLADFEAALSCNEQAIGIARRRADHINLQSWLANHSDLLRQLGRYAQAREAAEEGLGIARRLGDRRQEGRMLTYLAYVASEGGEIEIEEVLAYQAAAQEIAAELDDRAWLAQSLALRATIDDRSAAARAASQAAAILEELGRRADATRLRDEMGDAATRREMQDLLRQTLLRLQMDLPEVWPGSNAGAVEELTRLISGLREEDATPVRQGLLAYCLERLGLWLERADRPVDALAAYEEALQASPEFPLTGNCMLGRARALQAANRPIHALIAYQEAAARLGKSARDREDLGNALANVGDLAWHIRSYRGAGHAYRAALEVLRAARPEAAERADQSMREMVTNSQEFEAEFNPQGLPVLQAPQVEAVLRQIARGVEADPDLKVRARIVDGTVAMGRPDTIFLGTIPVLVIEDQGQMTSVPLEWLTELRPVLVSRPAADGGLASTAGIGKAADARFEHVDIGQFARAEALESAGDLLGALIAYQEAEDHFRADSAMRTELGLTLLRIGDLASRIRSFASARAAYGEAVEILRSASPDQANSGIEAMERMNAEADELKRDYSGMNLLLSVSEVREKLKEIFEAASAEMLIVQARLVDGTKMEGPPSTILIGTVPLLALDQDEWQMLVPLELLASLTFRTADQPTDGRVNEAGS